MKRSSGFSQFALFKVLALAMLATLGLGVDWASAAEHGVDVSDHSAVVAEGELHAAEEGHAAEGGHAAEESAPPELPNLFMVVQKALPEDSPTRHFLHEHFHNGWENVFFTYLIVFCTWVALAFFLAKKLRHPGRFQSAIESVTHGLFNFFKEIMGEQNARMFVPLVGSLFIFVFLNNIIGIVPLMKAPSAALRKVTLGTILLPVPVTTLALSLTVFLVVQFVGITRCGVLGRLHHLAGSPHDLVGWILAPLLFALEVIGELVKPVSLALRLFGNIFGEDLLLGAFAMMGVLLMGVIGLQNAPIGIPLQFPFLFLALLTSTIQAVVFSLLSSIYILLALPHHEHAEEEVHHVPQQ